MSGDSCVPLHRTAAHLEVLIKILEGLLLWREELQEVIVEAGLAQERDQIVNVLCGEVVGEERRCVL